MYIVLKNYIYIFCSLRFLLLLRLNIYILRCQCRVYVCVHTFNMQNFVYV